MAVVGKLFLDSGAFSLQRRQPKLDGQFFKSKTFLQYVNNYATFVIKYSKWIDYYANVDVIGNPEQTWQVQRYLEKEYGLNPVPVVHFGSDLKWLKKYIDHDYDYIGLGGLVKTNWKEYISWLDKMFNFMCPYPTRMPIVKTHGFGITSWRRIIRYPWFSIDSTTWAQAGGFGDILVPHKRNGDFTFNIPPYRIGMSKNTNRLNKGSKKHYNALSDGEKTVVKEWLKYIQVPLRKIRAIKGAAYRRIANLCFYQLLGESRPEWPHPLTIIYRGGFFD